MTEPSLWTAGLAPETDWMFASCPDDPNMRESVSVWFFADDGSFAAPRLGIEAEAANWTDRLYQANMALPGGRVLVGPGRGPATGTLDDQGRAAVLGAGPLRFTCREPFHRWAVHFDGTAADGKVTDQISGGLDQARRTAVRLDLELEMAVPAWGQVVPDDSSDAQYMGVGYRFEQLFRATGTVEVDGQRSAISGAGLRIHRQSKRELAGFRGHCWQSAVFADGRAFGYIAYPPGDGGIVPYNEGFLWDGTRMIEAKVTQAPWLRRVVPEGDDVSFVLASELGETRIEGSTVFSTFRMGNPDMGGLTLQQTGVRYRWDGQEAYGMLERSANEGLITIG
jgi:hypothetical protein